MTTTRTNRLSRRALLAALVGTRALLASGAVPGGQRCRIGLCAFSCHQHWKAVQAKVAGVKFADAAGFYRYARDLGAEGVQASLREVEPKRMRDLVEQTEGYYEAELRLPKLESDLPFLEAEVRRSREAGATVARAVFTGGRRYELFRTLEAFRAFHEQAKRTLALIEPVARRHRLRIAIENHKDHTGDELADLMRDLSSEWIGVVVDTGNNLALLEDPYVTLEALAPYVLSVHLKDMAVQPHPDGFLLSEVPLGTGFLDLPRVIGILTAANPQLVLNLEMATRDPLRIPCRMDAYFATFPDRRATHLEAALARVKAHPPQQPPPTLQSKETGQVLAEEETNNRVSLAWMRSGVPPKSG